MAALRSRCRHYIFALWFLLSFFSSPGKEKKKKKEEEETTGQKFNVRICYVGRP